MSAKTTSKPSRGRTPRLVAAIGLMTATALTLGMPTSQAANPTPGDGILCDANVDGSGSSKTFNLDAAAGYILEPDGNSIYAWSYTDSGHAFQFTGPMLCVNSGDSVTVTLHNTLPEATSIVFSGQDFVDGNGNHHPVQADGQNGQPALDSGGHVTSLVNAAGPQDTVTYTFTAGAPGTYLYSSGTDVTKQREMGLYGALVVRPAGHPNWANGRSDSAFDTDHEYVYLLSEMDPDAHLAVERGKAYDFTKRKSRYFLINGRSMPDTIAPNNAAWLPAQPYGAMIHVRPQGGAQGMALVRYLNAGTVNFPFHPHGSSQRVVTRDGVPVTDTGGNNASYLKFLVDVGPGQSVDAFEFWSNEYDPAANPIPSDVKLPQLQDQIVGPGTETWFSENPYLGAPSYGSTPAGNGPIPNGMVQNNECGEYYQIAHSHALEQSTNYGASFGGMMTLIRIDPPAGC